MAGVSFLALSLGLVGGTSMNMARTALIAMMAFGSTTVSAADVAAGRVTAQAKCSECHEADDWEGESAASLESLIRDIVDGKVKHKRKLELTAAEIANVAAYWGAGKK